MDSIFIVKCEQTGQAHAQDRTNREPSETDGAALITSSSLLEKEKMSELVSVTYHKLAVPPKMRSIYWRGFGFPANEHDQIITREKIICIFCRAAIAYNRNTSNLRMHLESKHPLELRKFEADAIHTRKGQRQTVQGIGQTVFELDSFEGELETLVPCSTEAAEEESAKEPMLIDAPNHPDFIEIVIPKCDGEEESMAAVREDNIASAITEFIISDLISPCVLEGSGFKNLVSTLRPGIKIPTQEQVDNELLPECHMALRVSVLEDVSSMPIMGVTLEEWPSTSGSFITISIYFAMEAVNLLEMRVLSSLSMPANVKEWCPLILESLQNWGIDKERIAGVTVASQHSAEIIKELRSYGFNVVPCLEFVVQQAVGKCWKNKHVSGLLTKCLAVKKEFSVAPSDKRGPLSTVHYPDLWLSTYEVLSRLLESELVVRQFYELQGGSPPLSPEEWLEISAIVDLLKPFATLIDSLKEEKFPSISLIRPFVSKIINSHLNIKTSDSSMETNMKVILLEEIINYYFDPDTELFLQTATYLDPRLKSLSYPDSDNSNLMIQNISKTLEMALGNSSVDEQRKESGLRILLENLPAPAQSVAERAKLELSQYVAAPVPPLDVSPVQWWEAARSTCPKLAEIARTFTCVPASVVPPSLLATEQRAKFCMRRSSIRPASADKIIFLHGNKNLFTFGP